MMLIYYCRVYSRTGFKQERYIALAKILRRQTICVHQHALVGREA